MRRRITINVDDDTSCHKLSPSVDKCREVTPEMTPEVEEE